MTTGKLLHLPVTLEVGPVSQRAEGEQASAHVIALWLLRVEPEDRERALDVVLEKALDDIPAEQRMRDMVVREFSAIVCHLQREHKQLSTLQ